MLFSPGKILSTPLHGVIAGNTHNQNFPNIKMQIKNQDLTPPPSTLQSQKQSKEMPPLSPVKIIELSYFKF